MRKTRPKVLRYEGQDSSEDSALHDAVSDIKDGKSAKNHLDKPFIIKK